MAKNSEGTTSKSKSSVSRPGGERRKDSAMFNLDELRALMEMLQSNDVTDFELVRGGEKLRLKRGSGETVHVVRDVAPAQAVAPAPVQHVAPLEQPAQASPAPAPATQPATAEASADDEQRPENVISLVKDMKSDKALVEITSPMVGTFYRRPAPDAKPYVEVGAPVKKGDVLCIVEAMKLMNEIESHVDGNVVQVCLEDGQMVEYGEVLYRVEPI